MSNEYYTVKVTVDTNGNTESIVDYDLLEYTPYPMNEIGNFRIVFNNAPAYQAKFALYKHTGVSATGQDNVGTVYIYRKTVLEFKGIIENVGTNDRGKYVISGSGWGAQMAKVPSNYRFIISSVSGTFEAGEVVTGVTSTDTGIVTFVTATRMEVAALGGSSPYFVATETINGTDSGASATVGTIYDGGVYAAQNLIQTIRSGTHCVINMTNETFPKCIGGAISDTPNNDPQAAISMRDHNYLDVLKHAVNELAQDSGGDHMDWSIRFFDDQIDKLNIENHKGTATSVGIMVEGIDISGVGRNQSLKNLINHCIVYGRGQGSSRAVGAYQDDTNIGTYGRYTAEVIAPNLTTKAALNGVAQSIVENRISLPDNLTFRVTNPDWVRNDNTAWTTGDEVSISSKSNNITVSYTGVAPDPNYRIVRARRRITADVDNLFFTVAPTLKTYLPGGAAYQDLVMSVDGSKLNQGVQAEGVDISGASGTGTANVGGASGAGTANVGGSSGAGTANIAGTSAATVNVTATNPVGHINTQNGTATSNAWNNLVANLGYVQNKDFAHICVNINNTDAGTDTNFFVRFRTGDGGTYAYRYFPDTVGQSMRILHGYSGTFHLRIPLSWFNHSAAWGTIQVDNDSGVAVDYAWSYDYFWAGAHVHNIGSYADSGHTGHLIGSYADSGHTGHLIGSYADSGHTGHLKGTYAGDEHDHIP